MDFKEIGAGIAAFAVGTGGLLLYVWKQVSSTRLSNTGDQAGVNMIDRLEAEVKRQAEENRALVVEIREAWAARTKDAVKIAEVTAESQRLTHDMSNLQMKYDALQAKFDKMESRMTMMSTRQDDNFGGIA